MSQVAFSASSKFPLEISRIQPLSAIMELPAFIPVLANLPSVGGLLFHFTDWLSVFLSVSKLTYAA